MMFFVFSLFFFGFNALCILSSILLLALLIQLLLLIKEKKEDNTKVDLLYKDPPKTFISLSLSIYIYIYIYKSS